MEAVAEQIPTAVQGQVSPPQAPQEQTVLKKGINKAYVLVGLVAIVLLLAGGAFAYTTFLSSKTTLPNNSALNSNSNIQKQVQKEVQDTTVTDTSDTQINKDLNNIDSNLNNLDSGTAAIDQGFNDQPVNLQ